MKNIKVLSLALFVIMLIQSCNTHQEPDDNQSYIRQLSCDSLLDEYRNDVFNFPKHLLLQDEVDTTVTPSFINSYYSYYLASFQENSLILDNDTVIRFMMLKSFDKPILIKIGKENDKIVVKTKVLHEEKGSFKGNVKYSSESIIADSVWESFFQQNFSRILSQKSLELNFSISDGSDWLLEFNIGGKYYIRERTSPMVYGIDRDSNELKLFEKYCMRIIDAANYPINKELTLLY